VSRTRAGQHSTIPSLLVASSPSITTAVYGQGKFELVGIGEGQGKTTGTFNIYNLVAKLIGQWIGLTRILAGIGQHFGDELIDLVFFHQGGFRDLQFQMIGRQTGAV